MITHCGTIVKGHKEVQAGLVLLIVIALLWVERRDNAFDGSVICKHMRPIELVEAIMIIRFWKQPRCCGLVPLACGVQGIENFLPDVNQLFWPDGQGPCLGLG